MVSMLENMKDFGSQVANKTNRTVDEVKKGAGEVANSAVDGVKKGFGGIATKAADMIDDAHESAVRTSTSQMCRMLEIAMEELKTRPLLMEKPVSLTAIVTTPIATLQMQINLKPTEQENSGESVALPKTA